jgi:hypothetical protein
MENALPGTSHPAEPDVELDVQAVHWDPAPAAQSGLRGWCGDGHRVCFDCGDGPGGTRLLESRSKGSLASANIAGLRLLLADKRGHQIRVDDMAGRGACEQRRTAAIGHLDDLCHGVYAM